MFHTNNQSQMPTTVEALQPRIMRGWLTCWLSVLLCTTQVGQAKQPVSQQLAKMPVGTSLAIDGKVAQGILASQSESGFELRSPGGDDVTAFSYSDVKSVNQVKPKRGGKGKWIAIGVAAAVGVALAVGLSGVKDDIAGR